LVYKDYRICKTVAHMQATGPVPVTVYEWRFILDFFTIWYNYDIKLGIYVGLLLLYQSMYFFQHFYTKEIIFIPLQRGRVGRQFPESTVPVTVNIVYNDFWASFREIIFVLGS
jgi:hypothetical protein